MFPDIYCDTTICQTIFIPDSCTIRNAVFNATTYQHFDTLKANFNFSANSYSDYSIDYGDGSAPSTQLSHLYSALGSYNTCITINNSAFSSCSQTICKQIKFLPDTINSCSFENTGFSHSVNGNIVTLNAIQTTSHSFQWQTDGGVFISPNKLEYATPGIKSLCLILKDTLWPSTYCDTTICHNFSLNIDSCPIHNVVFNATASQQRTTLKGTFSFTANAYTNYTIDYGDGSPASTQLNHIYNLPGTYNACLRVTNSAFPNCSQTICKQLTFTNDTTTYCHINNVQYNAVAYQNEDTLIGYFDFSADGYTSYAINYGDGSPLSTQFLHTYGAIGSYFTCLYLYNSNFPNCKDTICKQVTFIQDTSTLCDIITCVLPGDADHDLTVNNFDVLAIGLSYNRLGNIRTNATTQYVLQPSTDWNTTHHYGYNDKFADCDGNGIIRAGDAVVVNQNYIETPQNIFHYGTNPIDSLPAVKLVFDTLPNAIVNGDCVGAQLVADINVGSSSQSVDSAYGIAFSINYPFDNDSCFSIQIDAESNSWFQTNDQVLLFYKNIPQFRRVDVTIVRTDSTTKSGFGKIGSIKLITEGDIFGIYRKGGSVTYDFSVTDVVGINNYGKRIGLSGSSTSVNFITTGIKQNTIQGLKLYPNPTHDKIYINAKEMIESIRVLDLSGRVIEEFLPNKNEIQLDLSGTENGMYIIEIKGKNTVSYEKIFKQ